MSRPILSLEEEFTNYLTHFCENPELSQVKKIPDLIKRINKSINHFNFCRGQLFILEREERNIQDSVAEIRKLKQNILEQETSLRKLLYKEEIKGT